MHFKDYKGSWPWAHFTPREIACRHCGELWIGDGDMPEPFRVAMNCLQNLRELWGKPIVINSGHRCTPHNTAVGGAAASQHLSIAFDCRCPKVEQSRFVAFARRAQFSVARPYPEQNFVHLDNGPKRSW